MEGEITDMTSDEQDGQENEPSHEKEEQDTHFQKAKEAVPGVPIVRSNTPRPFMYSTIAAVPPSTLPQEEKGANSTFSTMSVFPAQPPSAPPLPEEPDEYEDMEERGTYTPVATEKPSSAARDAQEFVWLFEYALEMDSTHLNTPERLDGLALLYGAAVLKGYRLFLGGYEDESYQTLATIVPDARPDAEVWGVVYRVPRYTTQGRSDGPPLLETVHGLPKSGMSAMQVEVLETYRNRSLTCITYGYEDAESAAQQLAVVESQRDLNTYMRRLTSIAAQQKLPDTYIKRMSNIDISIPTTPARAEQHEITLPTTTMTRTEQHTEPIMLPVEKLSKLHAQVPQVVVRRGQSNRWFVAFALYLFCLLLAVLALAIVQGMGIVNDVLNDNFTLLHVPWLVLLYGLLGGCISSIITLGRTQTPVEAPNFVIITWFTRPFVGAVLALFAYLLLSSGLFSAVSSGANRPEAVFLLVGAIAGMCEGWLFLRKR